MSGLEMASTEGEREGTGMGDPRDIVGLESGFVEWRGQWMKDGEWTSERSCFYIGDRPAVAELE